jgi:hypothetical protein
MGRNRGKLDEQKVLFSIKSAFLKLKTKDKVNSERVIMKSGEHPRGTKEFQLHLYLEPCGNNNIYERVS